MAWFYIPENGEVIEAITYDGACPHRTKVGALKFAWSVNKAAQNVYQSLERKFREELVKELVPDMEIGTHNKDGFVVTLKYNYTVGDTTDMPAELKAKVIRTKEELSLTEYNKLTPQEQAEVSRYVSAKRAMPSLSIKEDKSA